MQHFSSFCLLDITKTSYSEVNNEELSKIDVWWWVDFPERLLAQHTAQWWPWWWCGAYFSLCRITHGQKEKKLKGGEKERRTKCERGHGREKQSLNKC